MKVAIDIDEVLAELLQGMLDHHQQVYGYTRELLEFSTYTWQDHLPNMTFELFTDLINNHPNKIKPKLGAIQAVAKINSPIAITARWKQISSQTKVWVSEYFPNIKEIHYVNCKENGRIIEKGDLAKKLGMDVLIEDQPKYAQNALDNGIRVILMDTPWNKGFTHPLLTRVKNWPQALNVLNSLEKEHYSSSTPQPL